MQAKILHRTKDMTEEQWLAHRREGIGGSDIAKVVGLSRWGNALTVYADKIGTAEPQEQNELMYWGHQLEDVVAREFAHRTGLKVRRVNAILQHPEHSWALANIDRMILCPERGKGILECKNVGFFQTKDWRNEDDEIKMPDEYLLQVQWYLAVTGLPHGYGAALIGGQRFVFTEVERDEELCAYLLKIGGEFWQMVQDRTIPALDEDGQLMGIKPIHDPPKVILPGTLAPKIARFEELKAQIKPLEKEQKAIKAELDGIMEASDPSCELFLCDQFQLGRKIVTTKRFNAKALKAEEPDTYARFVKESVQRRLTVKEV
jgi:putative phage-type endonuclease